MTENNRKRLKITRHNNEIQILGNKEGLEYLSKICLSVIGKTDPSGHWHFMPEMNNVSPGSEPTVIAFSDDEDDYE